ncbi:hypothetical protein [Mameliella sediminis]|uniref:hypothetical protein n=1 Tax=Mameliella sediminis TaxID=2836866 RepID=UPI001C44698A|nr:hypothetical protein [Mameliella sediminis]MBV7393312.1 hypothetical protein [Mameliella sediminis]MBY6161289.1 hypothetical protein [Mameliella alba]MBY6169759.1 hypothetical protein [Mameliella alba]MBY6174778.1 hypothetical protein [Mameliella alba]
MRPMDHAMLGMLVLGTPATAAVQAYACTLSRDEARIDLRFDLDPASFSPALDSREPPRRRVSRVTLSDGRGFEAEAILGQDGSRGFWADSENMLLTVAADGTARLSDAAKTPWQGQCKEID